MSFGNWFRIKIFSILRPTLYIYTSHPFVRFIFSFVFSVGRLLLSTLLENLGDMCILFQVRNFFNFPCCCFASLMSRSSKCSSTVRLLYNL